MISVIMPTIRTEWIVESINSFLWQEYDDSELIVVNDGADHDYESIIKEFNNDKIRYFKIDKVSIGEANNYAIKQAKGEFICPLHDDDILAPNSLKLRADAIGDNDVIWGASQKMSLQGVIGDVEPSSPPDKERIWKQDYISMVTQMWRKDIHDKIGWFADMSYDEDWHFEVRFLMECKCTWIKDVVMYYRIHSGQYSAIGREAGDTKKEEHRMRDEMRKRYNR